MGRGRGRSGSLGRIPGGLPGGRRLNIIAGAVRNVWQLVQRRDVSFIDIDLGLTLARGIIGLGN